MTLIDERVQAGIELLDEKGPENWREKIDFSTLNMSSIDDCILGQVYGVFFIGLRRLGIKYTYLGQGPIIELGFDATGFNGYEELKEAWKRALSN